MKEKLKEKIARNEQRLRKIKEKQKNLEIEAENLENKIMNQKRALESTQESS